MLAEKEAAGAEEQQMEAAEAAGDEQTGETGDCEELLAQARREAAEYLLRAERADWDRQAKGDFIGKLLPVLDNLELALGAEEGATADLRKGVEMIHRQFLQILQQEGVTPIAAAGCPFDPNLHEAVMQVEADDDVPADTVVAEVRRGYMYQDRVLRAAMVKVSR